MSKIALTLPTVGATTATAFGAADAIGAFGAAQAGVASASAGLATGGISLGKLTLGHVLAGAGILGAASGAQQQGNVANLIAQQNAEMLRREAVREGELANLRASEFGRDARRRLASFRAATGGSGARVGTGTFLDVTEDAAAEAEFQRRLILSGGDATSSRLRSQASIARAQGRSAKASGSRRAASLLLTGAGELFGAT